MCKLYPYGNSGRQRVKSGHLSQQQPLTENDGFTASSVSMRTGLTGTSALDGDVPTSSVL